MSKLTLVILASAVAAGAAVAAPEIVAAQTLTAATDLAHIHQVQTLSIANDGLFAPTIESFTSAEFGMGVEFREESQVAYLVNAGRTHYVAATTLPSGEVAVRSDENDSILCESYTVECVTQVTADAELLAAVPAWVAF